METRNDPAKDEIPNHRPSPVIESEKVNRMFAGIAGDYDRANHALSVGID